MKRKVFEKNRLKSLGSGDIYEVYYGTNKKCAIVIYNEKTKEILDVDNASDIKVDSNELYEIAEEYINTLK